MRKKQNTCSAVFHWQPITPSSNPPEANALSQSCWDMLHHEVAAYPFRNQCADNLSFVVHQRIQRDDWHILFAAVVFCKECEDRWLGEHFHAAVFAKHQNLCCFQSLQEVFDFGIIESVRPDFVYPQECACTNEPELKHHSELVGSPSFIAVNPATFPGTFPSITFCWLVRVNCASFRANVLAWGVVRLVHACYSHDRATGRAVAAGFICGACRHLKTPHLGLGEDSTRRRRTSDMEESWLGLAQ